MFTMGSITSCSPWLRYIFKKQRITEQCDLSIHPPAFARVILPRASILKLHNLRTTITSGSYARVLLEMLNIRLR